MDSREFTLLCKEPKTASETITVSEDLTLHEQKTLKELPANLVVHGFLDLEGCCSIRRLPENLTVDGFLDLSGCTNLERLPETLKLGGDLYLHNCTCLAELPENLVINGDLNLCRCTRLKKLPETLVVRDKISLAFDDISLVLAALRIHFPTENLEFRNKNNKVHEPSARVKILLEIGTLAKEFSAEELDGLLNSEETKRASKIRRV